MSILPVVKIMWTFEEPIDASIGAPGWRVKASNVQKSLKEQYLLALNRQRAHAALS